MVDIDFNKGIPLDASVKSLMDMIDGQISPRTVIMNVKSTSSAGRNLAVKRHLSGFSAPARERNYICITDIIFGSRTQNEPTT